MRLEDIAEGMELAGLPGEEQTGCVLKVTRRGAGAAKVRYVVGSGEIRSRRVQRGDEESIRVVNPDASWLFNPAYSDSRGLTLSMDAMSWSEEKRPRGARLALDRDFCAHCGPMLRQAAASGMHFPLTITGFPENLLALPSPEYCAQAEGTRALVQNDATGAVWAYEHDEASIMGAGIRGMFAGRGLDPRALVLDLTRAQWSVFPEGGSLTLRVELPAAFWDSLGAMLEECLHRDDVYFDLLLRLPTRRESMDSLGAVHWKLPDASDAASEPDWLQHTAMILFSPLREHEGMEVQWVPRLSISRASAAETQKQKERTQEAPVADERGDKAEKDADIDQKGGVSLEKRPAEEEAPQEKKAEEKVESVPEPEPASAPKGPVAEALAELSSLVGLQTAKKEVVALIRLQQLQQARREQGLPEVPMSNHLVFTGNPGTGKTTVAKILAKIYQGIGLLSKGQLIEVDRSGLVSASAAETEEKTQAAVERALGGILLIDDAYALASGGGADDYGAEATGALLDAIEKHPQDLIVILAGKPAPMKAFIASNPGLRAQFNKHVTFADHPAEELVRIFRALCAASGLTLAPDALSFLRRQLTARYAEEGSGFTGTRAIRGLFENVVRAQADRLYESGGNPDAKELATLRFPDIRRGWTMYMAGV